MQLTAAYSRPRCSRKSTRVTDANGGVREYFYDADGRMTKLLEPDGGILLFENQGDAIRSKKYDALGYATSYSYRIDKAFTGISDANGNVTREQDAHPQLHLRPAVSIAVSRRHADCR